MTQQYRQYVFSGSAEQVVADLRKVIDELLTPKVDNKAKSAKQFVSDWLCAANAAEQAADEKAKAEKARVEEQQKRARDREALTRGLAVLEKQLNLLPTTAKDIRDHLAYRGYLTNNYSLPSGEGWPLARFLRKHIGNTLEEHGNGALPPVRVITYIDSIWLYSGEYKAVYYLKGELAKYQRDMFGDNF